MSTGEVKQPFLSPLNQRRWQNFKANRRGYWSLWIFMILFILSLFTEFIANDKPIVASVDGKLVFPIFFHYSENDIVEPDDEFNLPTANFRDPFITEYVEENGWLLWPPIRYSYNTPNLEIPEPAPSKPSWLYDKETRCAQYENGVSDANCNLGNMNWLGTDNQGRDVLSRIIYGFRISVLFGLILTFASAVIGVSAGAVQGYFGGLTDLLFQRFIEIWSALPVLYLLLIISSVLAPGFWIPNAMVATLTFMPFILNGSITTLTSLDFLGFGLPPGSASIGELLKQGQNNPQAIWLGLSGFFVISLMLSLLIFIGEATRDAFDPRKTFE